MPTDRWHRLERLFAEAREQPEPERAQFLDSACGSDIGMRDEIGSLLSAVEESGDFLSTPALDVFARQISREGWAVRPGDRVGFYTVERRLGAGGMGEVWRARDERLARDVAIKLLLPHPSSAEERLQALQLEARAAGTLNHTNVLTVYDIGEHCGATYIVTECLEGEPLRARLNAGTLPVDTALDIALQVVRGLHAAHARGIVHRDLKPENIFLGRDGRVKILDFGLATLRVPAPGSSFEEPGAEAPRWLSGGTVGYMAPEQVSGEAVDRRADIFALGVVLYEMSAGCRPFNANTTLGTLNAVLTQQPPNLADANPDASPELCAIVRRCLAKSPDDRFATVAELETAIDSIIQARNRPAPPGVLTVLRRPAVVAVALTMMLAVAAGAWRWRLVSSRVLWARTIAAPEVQRLSTRGDFAEAFLLLRQALDILPDDPQLKQLLLDVSIPMAVTTDPPGADVAMAAYRTSTILWLPLGRSPLRGVRVPRGLFRVRISRPGFQPIVASGSPGALFYRLDPVDSVPSGMVRVVGGRDPVRFGQVGDLDDYWIDRLEITNAQFKEFVDQGGYRRRDYWREPFLEGGGSISWEKAIERFRDATGQPGPATWKSGTYAAGQGNFPVGGVSWYEASAYAAFAGKSLPTMYHWYRAAALGRFADILAISNFDGKGPAAVGTQGGVGPFGTYDMAGNVKEWCSTGTGDQRFILGGGWDEPRYMFADYDAKGPFERAADYGFRLVTYIRPLPAPVTAPVRIDTLVADGRNQTPVGDDIFAVYRSLYAYDRAPLNAVIEATEETKTSVRQTITFDAAYDGERLRAYLVLPRHVSPPYQTILFFPGGDAFVLRSSRDMSLAAEDLVVESGRAFFHPIYKGMYERHLPEGMGPKAERDLQIAWSRDLGRAIDYLETRQDIDRDRLAFYGVSVGADAGVIMTALEPRLKTGVFQGTGLSRGAEPEASTANFAPRVRIPTLLLTGRYDFEAPLETSQRPLFALLGSAAADKRHAIFEGGHALPIADVAREMLPWLDRYLGRVVP